MHDTVASLRVGQSFTVQQALPLELLTQTPPPQSSKPALHEYEHWWLELHDAVAPLLTGQSPDVQQVPGLPRLTQELSLVQSVRPLEQVYAHW